MNDPRKLPPIWMMGLTNTTFGLYGGFAVVTLPSMLSAEGLPGGRIAAIIRAFFRPLSLSFLSRRCSMCGSPGAATR